MKINEFIRQFCEGCDFEQRIIQQKNDFYLVQDEVKKIAGRIRDRAGLDPASIGLHLGTEQGIFRPSLALLELIAKESARKVFVNEKGEWLFVCGRDLMKGSIQKAKVNNGLVLVQNMRDENLGLGKILLDPTDQDIPKDKIVVKNIMNRGQYLGR